MEQLPDGPDVYGFQGVSKQLLVQEIDNIYSLSRFISDHESEPFALEVISLKRASASFYQQHKELFESEEGAPTQESFNAFLDGLTALTEKTKMVFSLMSTEGFLPAVIVGNLKEEAKQFKEYIDQYSAELESARHYAEDFADAKDKIEDAVATVSETQTICEAARKNVKERVESIESSFNSVAEWKEAIEETNASAVKATASIESIQSEIAKHKEDIEDVLRKSNDLLHNIEEEGEQSKQLLDEAKETLGNSNRVSMAASFKERREQLVTSLRTWGIMFVATILLSLACAICLFARTTGPLTWSQFVLRIAVMSPLVWLGWYSARQYGFTVRLMEDYAYKYAVSVAYEGFKKAVGETDPKLKEALLELSMFNMANSPMRVFLQKNNGVKGLPIEDAIEALKAKFDSVTKLTVNARSGTVIAEMAGLQDQKEEKTA